MPPGGIEPPTHGLGNRCSSPLSYGGEGRQAFYEPRLAGCPPCERCHTLYDMTAKRTSKVITVSIPPDAAEDFERIAEDEGRNRSELFREMLRVYRTYRETRTFESLQRYGAAQASRQGVRNEKDVERLIREARG